MKKIVLLIAMAIVSASAFAEFDLGIKASYISSLKLNDLKAASAYTLDQAKAEMGNGFNAGVFMRIGLPKSKFFIQPEVLYSVEKKEFSLKGALTDGEKFNINQVISAKTMDVPLLLGIKFLDLKIVNFRLLAGPKFRFDVGSKSKALDDTIKLDEVANEFRKASLGLEAGLDVEVLGKINVGVRYNLIKQVTKNMNWKNESIGNYNDPVNGLIVSVGIAIL